MKRVVIIGASTKPHRYSHKAALALKKQGHTVFLVGKNPGHIDDEEILTGKPEFRKINTITLYIRPELQEEMYDYIIDIKPKRIIFNPGTENPELAKMAKERGVETENACTLVLLSTDSF